MRIQPSAFLLVLTLGGSTIPSAAWGQRWAQRIQSPFRRSEPALPPKPVDRTITRVTLGTASGIPGETVVVPIEFTPGTGANLRSFKLVIDFRSRYVTFVKLDPGPAFDGSRMELVLDDSVTFADAYAPSSKVTLHAALLSRSSGPPGIPAGVIGRMSFKVDDNADGAIVSLDVTGEATEVGAMAPLPSQRFRAEEGAVFVLAPGGPGNGCFFFTH